MVQRSGVLIETYWNVKINAYNLIWNEWFVLIETYWNVKVVTRDKVNNTGKVLIETYWNVKKKEGEFV